jgi:hypothetical protein
MIGGAEFSSCICEVLGGVTSESFCLRDNEA